MMVPLVRSFPILGNLRPWVDRLRQDWLSFDQGLNTTIAVSYQAASKSLVSDPLSKEAVSARVKFWLRVHC
jgi:hypothetical protein